MGAIPDNVRQLLLHGTLMCILYLVYTATVIHLQSHMANRHIDYNSHRSSRRTETKTIKTITVSFKYHWCALMKSPLTPTFLPPPWRIGTVCWTITLEKAGPAHSGSFLGQYLDTVTIGCLFHHFCHCHHHGKTKI